MSVWTTDPADQRWFEFDWSSFLDAGETITSYTVTCDSELTKLADTSTTTAVLIQVSGGTAGTQSLITCVINTSNATGQHNRYETEKYVSIRTRFS